MGHSQMLLAVAGLKEKDVQKRAQQLAEGNWSMFSASERRAFQFAYRISKEPAKISADDIRSLSKAVGKHRAVDVIWYCSWCNYMTRIADAFQLPLEPGNVFRRKQELKHAND